MGSSASLKIRASPGVPREERLSVAQSLILERLPEDNYRVLKTLVAFLELVTLVLISLSSQYCIV